MAPTGWWSRAGVHRVASGLVRTSRWQDWPAARLLAAKQQAGTRISVVIPARNEQRTVGRVVAVLRQV